MVGSVDMRNGNFVTPFNAFYKLGVVRKTLENNFSLSASNENDKFSAPVSLKLTINFLLLYCKNISRTINIAGWCQKMT